MPIPESAGVKTLLKEELEKTLFPREDTVTPINLLYSPKHTWAQITPEGNIRVGLTEYAHRHLQGVAYLYTEPVGKEINKAGPFGVAETWMYMFDLYSPVSGKIVKVNPKLNEDNYIVDEGPYKGWILEIKPENPSILKHELNDLLSARKYNEMVANKTVSKLQLK